MNKENLIKQVARRTKVTKQEIREILATLLDVIQQAVSKGRRVSVLNFGYWESHTKPERIGRNPQDGSPIEIPEKTIPIFIASRTFKRRVDEKHKSKNL